MHFNLEKPSIDSDDLNFIKLLIELLEYRGIKAILIQGCEHG